MKGAEIAVSPEKEPFLFYVTIILSPTPVSNLTNITAEVIISQRATMTKMQTSHAGCGHRRWSCECVCVCVTLYVCVKPLQRAIPVCVHTCVCACVCVCPSERDWHTETGGPPPLPEMTGIFPDMKAHETHYRQRGTATQTFTY